MFKIIILLVFSLSSIAFAKDDHSAAVGPAPAAIFKDLQDGNARFVEDNVKGENRGPSRRKELATGQKPSAIILSCSDSRVAPELLFDKGLGELFVIRVAGNVLDAAGVASIEYAIEHLGARLIAVMGHESCGAVKAALSTPKGKSAGSADLDKLLTFISTDEAGKESMKSDSTVRKPVMFNVDKVADKLVKRSKIVKSAVDSGKISIVKAVYGLESGKVDFWGAEKVATK